jgi:hypothetical protein
MGTESRHARRFVFYAFSLLALVYVHAYIKYRIAGNFIWTRWVPDEEPLNVIFVALFSLGALGFVIAGTRAWFSFRESRGNTSPLSREINRIGILRTAAQRWRLPHLVLAAKLALGGVCILAFTLSLLASRKLDFAEWSIIPPEFQERSAPEEQASIVLSFSTPDDNFKEYLTCVRRIAVDLERAGAKVIVCAVPDTSLRADRRPGVEAIARVKNVLLYDGRPYTPPRRAAIPARDNKVDRMPIVTNVVNNDHAWGDAIQAWYPYASYSTRGFGTNEREIRMDASVAAVGRLLGLADDVRPARQGNSLVYGSIVMPVTGSGLAYSRTLWCTPSNLTPIATAQDDGSIAMQYYHYPEWEATDDIPARYASQFAGKIVLLDWLHDEPFGFMYEQFYASTRAMQSGIESMMHQSMLHPVDWVTISLLFISIAIGLAAMTMLPIRWGVILVIASGVTMYAGGVYGLHQYHVVLRTGYALLAAIICAVVLPYIRLLHERGEQEIAS